MNELLDLAVKAHGGLERWRKIKSIKVAASITGALWFVKGKGDVLKDITILLDTKVQRLVMDFPGQDKRSIFEADRIVIEKADGTLIGSRDHPEKSFAGHQLETPWDDFHVAYFSGEALWTYFTIPFLYIYEGFQTEEISSIQVEDEIWRRLKVTFPSYLKTHTREQISCFGPDGLLRRHEYTVNILGNAPGFAYASDYRDIEGIMVPTTRRIYAFDANRQKIPEPLLVAIDINSLTFSWD